MKHRSLAVIAVLLALSACKGGNQDATTVLARLRMSDVVERQFTYRTSSEKLAVNIRGKVEDELRYAMVLGAEKDLMDYVVRDDAVAVRLRDPAFGKRLANTLGDPVVDAALKAGKWVVDPSGAPPLIRPGVAAGAESSGDPLRDARELFRYVRGSVGQAREVRRFSLEDIEYRSSLDPWRYPKEDRSEIRYDMLRPRLPTSEGQTLGQRGDIGPSAFRKLSVFVKGARVEQVCSLIDIEGHEKVKELRERGEGSNPFLANLIKRIKDKETATPIEERYLVADVTYPDNVHVGLPAEYTAGKLETFLTALQKGIEAGALAPRGTPDTSECRRPGAQT